jgi:hypothetical protein
MAELHKLPRSMLKLTTSVRYAYTGMDICEESTLQYDVCAGQLVRNIGMFTILLYLERLGTMNVAC